MTNAAAYGIVREKKKDCVLPPGKRERRNLCRQATADIKLPARFLCRNGLQEKKKSIFGGGTEKGRLRGRE